MKKQKAFTLAELLVSILIISVILTLLAPVITKRVVNSSSITNSSSGSNINYNSQLFTYNLSDSACTQSADSENSLKCSFVVPSKARTLNALVVSGGGGGAGAAQPNIEYGKRELNATSTTKTPVRKEIEIIKGMKNLVVKELVGSGGGGGGASWGGSSGSGGAPQSQSDCDPYNALFIPAAYNGIGGKNLCVTKYNIGDSNGPTIASTVTHLNTTKNHTCPEYSTTCCWSGNTGGNSSSYCSINGTWGLNTTNYSGCSRTVCQWDAADASCATWAPAGSSAGSWRLPTKNEAEGWGSIISQEVSTATGKIQKYIGSKGLQLCDSFNTSYGSVYCYHMFARCSNGSTDDYCHPDRFWTSSFYTTQNYWYALLVAGGLGTTHTSASVAMSARCVSDNVGGASNSVLSGGGGGAGAYIKNFQIPDDIVSSNIGGKIVMYSAAGGAGGSSATSSGANASDGTNGAESYIEIYSKDDVLKWGLRVAGGNKGYGADSSNFGKGGEKTATTVCKLYEDNTWKTFNCTGFGLAGLDGAESTNATSNSTAAGGNGGGSMYNSMAAIGGGIGGGVSNSSGYQGSNYGAGGGGATIAFDGSNNALKGTGGEGANGVVELTYDFVYPSAAGGGGGGGAYVLVEDINVSAGTTYYITVGGAGKGGSISTNGGDGGESKIVFDTITYSLSGGKGGNTGTSATSSSEAVQGTGGEAGIVSTNVSDTSEIVYKNGSKGSDGSTFEAQSGSIYGGAYGGIGGKSGLDSAGGCGGLYPDSSVCVNMSVNGLYNQFISPLSMYGNVEYGSAGAGGGGGGWSENTTLYPNPGSGAQGQGGYVFIYWRE